MSGRRRSGHAAAAGLNLVSHFLQKQLEDRQALQQRAREIHQKLQLEEQQYQQRRADLLGTPLAENETRTLTSPWGISQSFYGKDRLAKERGVSPPSQEEANRLLLGATQGAPLSATPQRQPFGTKTVDGLEVPNIVNAGGIPSSPGGMALAQRMIDSGMMESPGAENTGRSNIPPHVLSQLVPPGPFVAGPGGTAIGGQMDPASMGGGVSREAVLALLGQRAPKAQVMAPPRPTAPTTGSPIFGGRSPAEAMPSADPAIARRIEDLRAGGWTDEDIVIALIQKEIDPTLYGL